MGIISSIRNPPRFYCSSCNRGFRRRKQHDDHVLFNRCKGMKTQKVRDNNQHIEHFIVDPELVSMKDEFVHTESQTTTYYGREYEGNNIPTGNRHLRCGIPFASDPLRRKT